MLAEANTLTMLAVDQQLSSQEPTFCWSDESDRVNTNGSRCHDKIVNRVPVDSPGASTPAKRSSATCEQSSVKFSTPIRSLLDSTMDLSLLSAFGQQLR
jgi:hypothetical protein